MRQREAAKACESAQGHSSDEKAHDWADVSDTSGALNPDAQEADDGTDAADSQGCTCCCTDPHCRKCMEPAQERLDFEMRQESRYQAIVAAQEALRQKRAAELAEWKAKNSEWEANNSEWEAKNPSTKRYREVTVTMPIADARALLKRKGKRLESLLCK